MSRKTSVEQDHYKTAGFKPGRIAVIAILVAVVAAAAAAGILYYRNLNRVAFESGMVYCSGGIEYDIPAGSTAIVDRSGVVTVDTGGESELLANEVPIYSKEQNRIILTRPMGYFTGTAGKNTTGSQLEVFTWIESIAGGVIMSKGARSRVENGAFLFDGADTYVLLDEAELHIGEEDVIRLPRFSYVTAVYNCYAQYYDRETGEFKYITYDFGDEYRAVSVHFGNGAVLDCDLDILHNGESSVLLSSAVSHLPKLLQEKQK